MKHLSPSRTRPVYPRAPTFPIVAPGVLFVVQAEQRYASTTRAPWALIENAVSWRLRTVSQRRRGRRAQRRRLASSCGHGRSHGGTVGCTALSGVVLGLSSHVFRTKVAISEITRVPSVDLTPRRLAPLALILWLRLVARTRCVFRLLLRRLRDARGRVFHVKHAVSPVLQECHRCARSAAILCCKLVLTLSTRRYPRSVPRARMRSRPRRHAHLDGVSARPTAGWQRVPRRRLRSTKEPLCARGHRRSPFS